jgi:hypothetical protein
MKLVPLDTESTDEESSLPLLFISEIPKWGIRQRLDVRE